MGRFRALHGPARSDNLGNTSGPSRFVRKIQDHRILLERIPAVTDVQSAWSLLLHCASARANYILRVARPDLVREIAAEHDQGIWQCCYEILGVSSGDVSAITRDTATLPLALGGLGLRSATLTSLPAFWASWADCLRMIHKRHPTVAENQARELEGDQDISTLPGFELPSWFALVHGTRPPLREPEDHEPGASRSGWQHEASIHTAALRPPGRHTTARELQTCTFQGPGASKTPPKFHEKTPRETQKRARWWREREKKSANFWASHPSGLHPSGPHFFQVWAPTLCEGCLVVRSGHDPQAEVAQGVGPGPLVER